MHNTVWGELASVMRGLFTFGSPVAKLL